MNYDYESLHKGGEIMQELCHRVIDTMPDGPQQAAANLHCQRGEINSPFRLIVCGLCGRPKSLSVRGL